MGYAITILISVARDIGYTSPMALHVVSQQISMHKDAGLINDHRHRHL